MSEKFLNDMGLNLFYQGLKSKFLKYDAEDCNTYLDGRIKNYLESYKFSTGSGVTDLEGYIKYLITEMMSSETVESILNSKYDDVKVFDFYTLYEACNVYINLLEESKTGKTDEEIDLISDEIVTLESFKESVTYGLITTEDEYNDKYDVLSNYVKDYFEDKKSVVGKAFTLFPYKGLEDSLYVDDNTGIQYVWSNLDNKYEPTAQPISQNTLDSLFG